jgi:hypothetical protein
MRYLVTVSEGEMRVRIGAGERPKIISRRLEGNPYCGFKEVFLVEEDDGVEPIEEMQEAVE